MSASGWSGVRNLLAVRLDSLGDVLMTTPALRAFKETLGCRMTLLTSPSGAGAARHVPEVDDTLAFLAPWMKAAGAAPTADAALIESLRARAFDAAVIFTVYSQNPLPAAYLCLLAGIPRRLAHCRENPYQLLTDWQPEPEPERLVRHEVQRQLALAACVGCRASGEGLSFAVPDAARRRVGALRLRRGYIVVHPGASAPSRRYPPEQFACAMDLLATQTGREIVFTGEAHERPLVEQIRAAMLSPARSCAGRLDLGELGALIEAADLLVCNNTGPAHVAAALGTPVVDLYALTNPQHTPWQVRSRVLYHDVPCRNCYKSICPKGHHDCLRRVAPERVAAAGRELLETAC
ncbi:MAG TPA: glycosyltransferase family 9 protein [Myxococcota bacterium]|jgi:lipopolysaccharide heptosyltransferase II|nr:glycosyltransferase family 9 protein [Myxococcota bacterium]